MWPFRSEDINRRCRKRCRNGDWQDCWHALPEYSTFDNSQPVVSGPAALDPPAMRRERSTGSFQNRNFKTCASGPVRADTVRLNRTGLAAKFLPKSFEILGKFGVIQVVCQSPVGRISISKRCTLWICISGSREIWTHRRLAPCRSLRTVSRASGWSVETALPTSGPADPAVQSLQTHKSYQRLRSSICAWNFQFQLDY